MDILRIIVTSVGSMVVLFLLTKLIGNHQMSQMTMFDYITGITIGSIAAEMATSLENDFLKPLTAMVVYGLLAVLIAFAGCKSLTLRKFFSSTPVLLYESGKLYKKNLAKAKLDLNEFLTQCRTAGYFDLSQIAAAILESNGQISFLPISTERPLTPKDIQLTPPAASYCVNVIIDGKLILENLKFTGNNEEWLNKKLAENKVSLTNEVFLATCDIHNKLCVYKKINTPIEKDIFV